MDLLDAIRLRRTTNSKFAAPALKPADLRLILEAAANSYVVPFQPLPWKLILIADRPRKLVIAELAGKSMKEQMEGPFFERYKKYFRFSSTESEQSRDGILIDRMPAILRPFIRLVFSPRSGQLMGVFGASRILGKNQQDIVVASPLIIAVAMDRSVYKPTEPVGLLAGVALGALVQSFWLTTTSLGIGMQFISLPLEVPERKAYITAMLRVPESHELVALFRMGYKDVTVERNTIDWVSNQRKRFEDLTSFDYWGGPPPAAVVEAPSTLWTSPPEASTDRTPQL
jgi:nitroreductase